MKLTGDETQRVIGHLTAIRFGLQLLRRETRLPARSARILDSTESAANALTGLVIEHVLADPRATTDPSLELLHPTQRGGAAGRTRMPLSALVRTLVFCARMSTRAGSLSQRILRRLSTLPPLARSARSGGSRRPILSTEAC
jgi:hypothetical protein